MTRNRFVDKRCSRTRCLSPDDMARYEWWNNYKEVDFRIVPWWRQGEFRCCSLSTGSDYRSIEGQTLIESSFLKRHARQSSLPPTGRSMHATRTKIWRRWRMTMIFWCSMFILKLLTDHVECLLPTDTNRATTTAFMYAIQYTEETVGKVDGWQVRPHKGNGNETFSSGTFCWPRNLVFSDVLAIISNFHYHHYYNIIIDSFTIFKMSFWWFWWTLIQASQGCVGLERWNAWRWSRFLCSKPKDM